MKKVLSLLAILSVCLLSVSSVQASVVQIDTFDAGNLLQQFGPGTNSQTTSDSSILGGSRDETITVRNLGGAESFGLFDYTAGGEWNVAQGSADQIFGGLTYDNFTDFDLTNGGENLAFALDVTQTDSTSPISGVIDIVVQAGGNTESVGVTLPANSTLPESVYVSFANFTTIDFTQVDSIALNMDFQSEPGRDFRITEFRAVPEPTGAIAGLVVLGGFLVRRRRKV